MIESRHSLHRRLVFPTAIALIFFFQTTRVFASEALTADIARIFKTGDFNTRGFGPARWADGGAAYLTIEPSAEKPGSKDLVRYETATGKRQVLVPAAMLVPAGQNDPLDIEDYEFSADNRRILIYTNSRKVWRRNTRGDYWLFDRETKKLRKLGGNDAPPSSLMFAKFSPDAHQVAYVRANNIYVEDLSTGAVKALTADGSETSINGASDWVYEEELDVRDGFRWSPDGRAIAYWHFDSTGVGEFTLINNTAGAYPALTKIPYPTAGTTNSAVKIGVVDIDGGPTRWMDVPGDPRENYIARMDWADNSKELVLQHLNRLQNRNDVLLADARTGAVKEMYRDEDRAWVDVVDEFRWFKGGERLLWLSERDGWRRAYTLARNGKEATTITKAPGDVIRLLAADTDGEWLYYIASPEKATERHLYRSRVDGTGAPERLTPAASRGTHSYLLSPDCRWAFHSYSTFDQPPITELVSLPDHKVVRVFEDNKALRANVAPFLAAKSEFFQVDVGGGIKLDGWMIVPPDFDPARKYPVMVHVYGEPAGVTVTDSWGGKGALFHRALAKDGYIVVSFDNRGTPSPKGRAWRKVVYGEIGVLSSKEQTEAVRALAASRSYIDLERMGVWGWSGGGSNTLNLMFRSPNLFKVGVAVAPVADQRYYDTIYQERYMGLPKDNAEGYRVGSPINFAEGLKGNLLVIHGSGDDNVHIQGTELLVNRLIALGKTFDYFVYPNRTHSISEGAGTSFHLYSKIAGYIEEHLPSKDAARQNGDAINSEVTSDE